MNRTHRLLAVVGVVSISALVACGSSSSTSSSSAVTVTKQWIRTTPTAAAAYGTFTSSAGDKLVKVAVDPAVAKTAELHETMEVTGEMTMAPLTAIPLPAGKAVQLAPGGLHIMLTGLVKPLTADLTLTLTFEKAGDQQVTFPLLETAP
jgi:copper(I)-binding protein